MKKLILILVGIVSVLFAQKNNFEGKVIHQETKAALAEVKLLLFEDNQMVKSVKTDFNGQFSIPVKSGRNYLLKVSKVSYEEQTIRLVTNQDFFESLPYTIQLPSLTSQPNLSNVQEGLERKVPNASIAEDIGNLSNLPPGSKIIDVQAVEIEEQEHQKFNVNRKKKDKTTVDTDLIKTTFNKESIEKVMYTKDDAFPSSYVVESSIFYDAGRVLLTPKVKDFLTGVAEMVRQNLGSKIKLYAFADGAQESEVGEFISKKRAEEISNYLIYEADLDFSNLEVIVKGNNELPNGCYPNVECDEFQHQENRRVDIVFTR